MSACTIAEGKIRVLAQAGIKRLKPISYAPLISEIVKPEDVPVFAITMGVGTILESRDIMLLASGANKAAAVAAAIEGPVTSMCTASALQLHRETLCILDRQAAGDLKMIEYYEWIQNKRPDAP